MRILIRADASAEIGSGHVTRSQTLAQELRRQGAEVLFVCRPHTGNMIADLKAMGFQVLVLPETKSTSDDLCERWVGATQDDDVAQTVQIAEGSFDWLIVDHYGLGVLWEKRARRLSRKLMVIDDMANRSHDCDLLLDQNYWRSDSHPYRGLVPANCKLLLGPNFALLKPEYKTARHRKCQKRGSISKVFIFFGGGDNTDILNTTFAGLSHPGLRFKHLDVVLGQEAVNKLHISQRLREKTLQFHHKLPHLANLLQSADIAIGAGGSTTWERICMGVPCLTISIADNQRRACEALAQDKFISYLGQKSDISSSDIANGMTALTDEREKLDAMINRGRIMVDGFGTSRVANIILDG